MCRQIGRVVEVARASESFGEIRSGAHDYYVQRRWHRDRRLTMNEIVTFEPAEIVLRAGDRPARCATHVRPATLLELIRGFWKGIVPDQARVVHPAFVSPRKEIRR